MNETNTGGPAYPTNNWQKLVPQSTGYHEGMTLRDYFAAKAMTAIIQSGKWGPQTADLLHYEDDRDFVAMKAGCLAEGAYQMADAMLGARNAA